MCQPIGADHRPVCQFQVRDRFAPVQQLRLACNCARTLRHPLL
ncbi:hypothetical protein IMCC9480_3058 [Oxalobacteraceae bacterium IMCC9480]|nr:hypothetical protein IMCC9480_3058 [Oxalobacteraceae bacterium IMCC9480]